MQDQTDMQMAQIYEQIELLAKQAEKIKQRKWVSEQIYGAEMGFEPLINHHYHLYKKNDETMVLSMVAKNQWGRSGMPYAEYISEVVLLADHTWDVLDENSEE